MEYKGITKKRSPQIKIGVMVFVIVMLYVEILRKDYIYIPLLILVGLAAFFQKEHIISEKGADIKYTLFKYVNHNYWYWNEITTLHTDYKRAKPNVMLHIGKDIVTRSFVIEPSICQSILELATEMNPDIYIEDMTEERQEELDREILQKQKIERAQRAAKKVAKRKK